ncbi:serine-type D-Ala-D-Ala carboxypeptidase [Arthrobacter sp. PAMC 25486]|uniref:D-alanyl-D-alanine carboxypeptidase/D-alanyl-D-alanine-endopeptidase n=1 Tax=Arthrobacter sp. PAMC 25486 TaxID=1494608 RepID=UPI0005361D51|nr:D-alanyl-D-alanine carboxypeptidase [Arthrobacter sp. PAMC 25486]AIY02181.1 serine-type D-Ala-D-Ala carboxypeptidase [Arthrobacter sp. PAMC 25486]
MGRTSKVVTSGLLICALAAVSVPVGMELFPAFLPKDPAAVAVVPTAQLAPTTLHHVTSVAPLSPDAPLPDAARLSAELKQALKSDGAGTFSVYVADALTGRELFSQDGKTARIPASNLKLLTAGAALKTLGPDTRFTTNAVAGEKINEIVLVAGGDSMLAAGAGSEESVMGRAGLETLAKETAAALATKGTKAPVTISIDDTLFTGPALNPAWASEDVEVGEIAPIYPMALNAGRVTAGELSGPRPQDSAVAVAESFARELEKAGVATMGTITRSKAPAAPGTNTTSPSATASPAPSESDTGQPAVLAPGVVLASVESATVAEQTRFMLEESDNYVAEVLGRMVADKMGKPATNDGAVAAVRQAVTALGLPMDTIVTVDNCGLALEDLISPAQLVQFLSLLLDKPGADAALALPGLPIAGLSGSLANRFVRPPSLDGAGLVRAKTGSLILVTALSGYVVNSDGRLLVFSILGNGLSDGAAAARPVVDAAAAVLAKS